MPLAARPNGSKPSAICGQPGGSFLAYEDAGGLLLLTALDADEGRCGRALVVDKARIGGHSQISISADPFGRIYVAWVDRGVITGSPTIITARTDVRVSTFERRMVSPVPKLFGARPLEYDRVLHLEISASCRGADLVGSFSKGAPTTGKRTGLWWRSLVFSPGATCFPRPLGSGASTSQRDEAGRDAHSRPTPRSRWSSAVSTLTRHRGHRSISRSGGGAVPAEVAWRLAPVRLNQK